jgi:hypothetical protein
MVQNPASIVRFLFYKLKISNKLMLRQRHGINKISLPLEGKVAAEG